MANSLVFDIVGNDKSALRALDRVGDRSEKTGKRISHSFLKVGATLTGALAGVASVRVFKSFIDEAEESRRVGRLTAQVIKTTGKAAKVTAGQVGDLATAISNKTGVDDEAIQSASNLLLTFTGVRNEVGKGNKIFNRATQAAVDMAAVLGGDASSKAIMLGKALNDPVKGITALTRAGVSFTEQQKKQIKEMVKAGDVLGAQKIILAELGKEFGGAAAAASTPMDKLNVRIGNLKETIGTSLLPVVDRFATFMNTEGVPAIEGFIGGIKDGTGAGGKFADAVGEVGDAAEQTWKVAKPFLGFIADHPKLFTQIALGAGAFATSLKIMGSVKKLPGLGSLVSKAAPLPVFVVNNGVGLPGGKGGSKVPPVVSKNIPKVAGLTPLLALTGLTLANRQHKATDFIQDKDAKLIGEMIGRFIERNPGRKPDLPPNIKLPSNASAAALWLRRYGDGSDAVQALINKFDAAGKQYEAGTKRHVTAVVDILGKGGSAGGEKFNTSLNYLMAGGLNRTEAFAASKGKAIGNSFATQAAGGLGRAKERADDIRDAIVAIPSRKNIDVRATLTTSGREVSLGTVRTDGNTLYLQARGGKQLLADGGWVRGAGGPRADKVSLMGSDGEFMLREKVASKYPRQVEALNAGVPLEQVAGGGTTVHMTNHISVPDRQTALSVPDALQQRIWAKGLW